MRTNAKIAIMLWKLEERHRFRVLDESLIPNSRPSEFANKHLHSVAG